MQERVLIFTVEGQNYRICTTGNRAYVVDNAPKTITIGDDATKRCLSKLLDLLGFELVEGYSIDPWSEEEVNIYGYKKKPLFHIFGKRF